MYTEDDKDTSLNNEESSSESQDFYTSFNDIDEKAFKKTKKKKRDVAPSKNDIEEPISYSLNEEDDTSSNNNSNKKNIIKIAIGAGILIIVVILLIILLSGKKESPDITLMNEEINVKAGESSVISYKIINTDKEVEASFKSKDPTIAIVDGNGKVTGIREGITTVIVSYTIGNKEDEKECKVKVTGGNAVDSKISLDVKLNGATDNKWTNKDVTINVSASSIFGITSLKYAVNCEDNCTYQDIKDNKIVISNPGSNKVLIVAQDKGNQKEEKKVTINIDKEAPKITFNESKNITSKTEVNVCATCTDNLSGCNASKVCKKFTSSKENQRITVSDKAGNTASSPSFNVKITGKKVFCTLKVSSTGQVTASVDTKNSSYYGFSSSYLGKNEQSMQVNISASKKGETLAKIIQYYVKEKDGTKGSCYLTVIKECDCTDKNSTDANCPVTCTFKAN